MPVIEHIGSTAIGHMWTKNTLDVAVLLPNQILPEQLRYPFENAGYQWLGSSALGETARRYK